MSWSGQEVGFLIVGAGFLGSRRAAAVVMATGARLVAIHDRDPQAAREVAERHGVETVADYRAALRRPDIDAVIVATPHADHYEQVLIALEHGKHVLCEKPLTIDPDDARRLALQADESRVRLASGFNHRFYPPISDALEIADAGMLGKVQSVRAEIGHMASSEFLASWHTDVSRSGGGSLMDNGPHACDLFRRLLGEIVAAKAYCRKSPGMPEGCETEAFVLFRDFDQGFAELRTSWNQPRGYLSMDVRGTQGWLRVETAPWALSGRLANGRSIRNGYLAERVRERLFQRRFGTERSLVREVEGLLVPSMTPTRAEATGWDGCRVTEMIDAAYRASESGEEIELRAPLVNLPSAARRRALGERAA